MLQKLFVFCFICCLLFNDVQQRYFYGDILPTGGTYGSRVRHFSCKYPVRWRGKCTCLLIHPCSVFAHCSPVRRAKPYIFFFGSSQANLRLSAREKQFIGLFATKFPISQIKSIQRLCHFWHGALFVKLQICSEMCLPEV